MIIFAWEAVDYFNFVGFFCASLSRCPLPKRAVRKLLQMRWCICCFSYCALIGHPDHFWVFREQLWVLPPLEVEAGGDWVLKAGSSWDNED